MLENDYNIKPDLDPELRENKFSEEKMISETQQNTQKVTEQEQGQETEISKFYNIKFSYSS